MAVLSPPRPRSGVTPDDLLNMEDGHRFELIDGKLVERNMGQKSSVIAYIVNVRLGSYIAGVLPGWGAGADCGFRIFSDPGMVRFADGSYTAGERLPDGLPVRGHSTVAPELVLEVVSPNDKADEVDAKARVWLSAGVRLVWVVYPAGRYVQIWRANGDIEVRREGEELDGEDAVPGFSMPISEIFERLKSAG